MEWRGVVGWESRYEVSDEGHVRSLDYERPNLLTGGVSKMKGRLLKPCDSGQGYLRVYIGGKVVGVHKLVCEAFHGPKPETAQVIRHLNGNSLDNRAENLKWGTYKENEEDKILHGTDPRSRKFCKRGHEYTPENTYVDPKGGRRCRECTREKARKKKLDGLPDNSYLHGTPSGYLNYSCRCEACKLANYEYTNRNARRRRAEARELADQAFGNSEKYTKGGMK